MAKKDSSKPDRFKGHVGPKVGKTGGEIFRGRSASTFEGPIRTIISPAGTNFNSAPVDHDENEMDASLAKAASSFLGKKGKK
jgi:hypothetical protein